MSRRHSKDQMTFCFSVSMTDQHKLEGGDQENLSDFERQLRMALKATLDSCRTRATDPLDRYEVAARMSRLLGREISKSHVDQWTAMSTVERRMHVDALRAFCEVTGDWRAFHCFVESCGFKALSPEEAVCAEYGAFEAVMNDMASKRKILKERMDDPQLLQRLADRIVKNGGQS